MVCNLPLCSRDDDGDEDFGNGLRSSSELSHGIDSQLREDGKSLARQIKIILLGAGGSGKSTILKQMRILYAQGFDKSERRRWRGPIFSNLLTSLQQIIDYMYDNQMSLANPDLLTQEDMSLLLDDKIIGYDEDYPIPYFQLFKKLWQDDGIQIAVEHGNEYALYDNIHYMFGNLDRFFTVGYIPSDQDILRCRLKTSGLYEMEFQINQLVYRMFDIGGQKSERRKWIHCFENVTACIFVVAISAYDQVAEEDHSTVT